MIFKLFFGLIFMVSGLIFIQTFKASRNKSKNVTMEQLDKSQAKLVAAAKNLKEDMAQENSGGIELKVIGLERREDEKFVFFDVALDEGAKIRQINVQIKNSVVTMIEKLPNAVAKKDFTIDNDLDEDHAQISIENDNVIIKIPKKVKK